MRHDRSAGHGGRDHRQVQGPSQRQLRAGELVRHALVEILREEDLHDEALEGASITVTEVRMSPDLKHATCFIEPLGGGHATEVVKAMNRHAKFLRGRLGHQIELKFTPELRFVHDESFDAAARMDALFNRPEVRRDLEADELETDENDGQGDAG
jgi:ribosome-binding factor A